MAIAVLVGPRDRLESEPDADAKSVTHVRSRRGRAGYPAHASTRSGERRRTGAAWCDQNLIIKPTMMAEITCLPPTVLVVDPAGSKRSPGAKSELRFTA